MRFRDPVQVPRIRDIGSLKVHTRYLTFSLKEPWLRCICVHHVIAHGSSDPIANTAL